MLPGTLKARAVALKRPASSKASPSNQPHVTRLGLFLRYPKVFEIDTVPTPHAQAWVMLQHEVLTGEPFRFQAALGIAKSPGWVRCAWLSTIRLARPRRPRRRYRRPRRASAPTTGCHCSGTVCLSKIASPNHDYVLLCPKISQTLK